MPFIKIDPNKPILDIAPDHIVYNRQNDILQDIQNIKLELDSLHVDSGSPGPSVVDSRNSPSRKSDPLAESWLIYNLDQNPLCYYQFGRDAERIRQSKNGGLLAPTDELGRYRIFNLASQAGFFDGYFSAPPVIRRSLLPHHLAVQGDYAQGIFFPAENNVSFNVVDNPSFTVNVWWRNGQKPHANGNVWLLSRFGGRNFLLYVKTTTDNYNDEGVNLEGVGPFPNTANLDWTTWSLLTLIRDSANNKNILRKNGVTVSESTSLVSNSAWTDRDQVGNLDGYDNGSYREIAELSFFNRIVPESESLETYRRGVKHYGI